MVVKIRTYIHTQNQDIKKYLLNAHKTNLSRHLSASTFSTADFTTSHTESTLLVDEVDLAASTLSVGWGRRDLPVYIVCVTSSLLQWTADQNWTASIHNLTTNTQTHFCTSDLYFLTGYFWSEWCPKADLGIVAAELFRGRMPFLPANQQHHSTEGRDSCVYK